MGFRINQSLKTCVFADGQWFIVVAHVVVCVPEFGSLFCDIVFSFISRDTKRHTYPYTHEHNKKIYFYIAVHLHHSTGVLITIIKISSINMLQLVKIIHLEFEKSIFFIVYRHSPLVG